MALARSCGPKIRETEAAVVGISMLCAKPKTARMANREAAVAAMGKAMVLRLHRTDPTPMTTHAPRRSTNMPTNIIEAV